VAGTHPFNKMNSGNKHSLYLNGKRSRKDPVFLKRAILFVFKIILTISYSTIFVYVLFFARRRRHLSERFLNLKPIKGTIDNFRKINPDGNHEYFNFYSNLLGNIVLFIPFSIIVISLTGIKNNKKVMLIAFISSVLVELLQYVFYRGVADVDDVILNVIGALLGCVVSKIFIEKWEAMLTR
jgi:glycopeptide antibiotics resistance protein